jgi:large repetitive protein
MYARSTLLVCLLSILTMIALPGLPAIAQPAVSSSVDALPHRMPPHPSLLKQLQAQGYDSATVVSLSSLRALEQRKKALGIDAAAQIAAPVTGSRPALVLLVDFSDVVHDPNAFPSRYADMLFSVDTYAGVTPSIGSMRDFFRAVSYNNFDISPGGVDSAWRQLSHAHNYYANADGIDGTADDYGEGSYPNNSQGMVVDAVNAADPYINFASYAVGGVVPSLFVIHAGRGAESGTGADTIWSHSWALNTHALVKDGVVINAYTTEPEYIFTPGDSTIGVFCHEYSHNLGLPDLYDIDYTSQGLGNWSLMAGGSWNGCNGSAPAWPDAWSRTELGWTNVITVTSNLTAASIPAAEVSNTVYKLGGDPNMGMAATEYFLIENRQQVAGSADYCLPGAGLCIYHIDETKSGNSSEWYPGHTTSGNYLVALEQADGLWELEKDSSSGDGDDPWPGGLNKRSFNSTTTPDTKTYGGVVTNIAIETISDSSLTMTANLRVNAAPVAPANLTATPATVAQVNLAWTDNSNNETGFKIERKTGAGGAWGEVGSVAANTTTFSSSGLTAGQLYYFRVYAYNANGNSEYSNEASAAPYAVKVPSNVTATATSTTAINVTWTDNSTDETGFSIERKTGDSGTWAEIGTVGANVTAFSNSGLTLNTTYYYRLRAFNALGYSSYSNQASATTFAVVAPSTLTATPITDTQINIAWTDNSTDETGFRIERKTGSAGTWAEITTVGANVTAYANTGLAAGTNYYYRVRAYNATGNSAYSNEANATTYVMTAPSGLTATPATVAQVNLAWTDNSTTETGFRIERKTGAGGTWAEIATVGASVKTYQNTGLSAGILYYFRVRAYNGAGYSAYSAEASGAPYATKMPTNVAATAVSGTEITVTWTDASTDETGFSIERKTGSAGTWAEVGKVAANVTSFASTGLVPSTTYYFRLRAFNALGYSAYTSQVSATTKDLPLAPSNLTLTVANTAQINLSWTDNSSNESGFKIEMQDPNGSWAQIGTVGAGVKTYQSTGLNAATQYTYRVCAYNANGDSTYSNTASATTYATKVPLNLAATPASGTQINLSWTDNSTDETGFSIERKTGSSGTWAEIATVGANVTSYANTGLAVGTTYYYRMRAFTALGYSAYTSQVSATTPTPPAAPTNLTLTVVNTTQINLAWTDNASNETGFKIERKTGAGGTWAEITTVGANVTSYQNTSLAAGTLYYYRVCAYNAGSNSGYSNEASATTYATKVPSNLAATAVSGNEIDLTWTDNATDETGFSIERKTGSGGAWAEVGTVGANVTSYASTGLTSGTTYYFRLRAYNALGYSAYTSQVSATTLVAPTAPTNLTLTVANTGQINLAWTDNATTETGFRIERKTGAGGTWAEVATLGANVVTYQNTGLAAGTLYYYRVCAYNGNGNSAYSNESGATTYATKVPSNLAAAAATSTIINLTWTDNSTDETGFSIERKTGSAGTWAEITTVGPNVTGYANTGLTANTTYYYRMRAFTALGYSAYTSQVSATTTVSINAPTNLTATPASVAQINLAWTDNATNETGFKIERKTGAAGSWSQIATVGANVTSYPNSGLAAGTLYYYRVRAYSSTLNSAYTLEVGATTYATKVPTNLIATAAAADTVNLTWTDNATDETGFSIERRNGSTGAWTEIATVSANITSYQNTGLVSSSLYYYRIRAFNALGYSSYSNTASATTFALAAPTGLTATAVSPVQINLRWTDNARSEVGYTIERKRTATGTWEEIGNVAANVTTYQSTRLLCASPDYSSTYFYRVRAYDGVIHAPTDLHETAVYSNRIDLAWTDNSANETGFTIERTTGYGNPWVEVGTVGANVTSYSSTGLTPNTRYYYHVRAFNPFTFSDYSESYEVETLPAGTPPVQLGEAITASRLINLLWTGGDQNRLMSLDAAASPLSATTDDVATGGTSAYSNEASATTPALPMPSSLALKYDIPSHVEVTYQNNTAYAMGDDVEFIWLQQGGWEHPTNYSDPPDDWPYDDEQLHKDLGTIKEIVHSWLLSAANIYDFRVRVWVRSKELGRYLYAYSNYSSPAQITMDIIPPPRDLTATAISTTDVALHWTNVPLDYPVIVEVYRRLGTNPNSLWSWVGMTDYFNSDPNTTATSFTDPNAAAGTTYTYKVAYWAEPVDSMDTSDFSNEVVVTTPGVDAPGNLTATAVSTRQINLAWTDTIDGEDGYQIEVLSHTGTPAWYQVGTAGPNATSYQCTGPLVASCTYTFRIRAAIGNAASAYSNEATATTRALNLPTNFTATPVSYEECGFSYTDTNTEEDSYRVEYSPGLDQWYDTVYPAPVVRKFISNSTYKFRVSAYQQVPAEWVDFYDDTYVEPDHAGRSDYTDSIELIWPALPPVVTLASAAEAANRVRLTWTNGALTMPAWIRIERMLGSNPLFGVFSEIAQLRFDPNAPVTTYVDTSVGAFTTYTYRIRYSSSIVESGIRNYSTYANNTTVTTPAASPTTAVTAGGTVANAGKPGAAEYFHEINIPSAFKSIREQ